MSQNDLKCFKDIFKSLYSHKLQFGYNVSLNSVIFPYSFIGFDILTTVVVNYLPTNICSFTIKFKGYI
jgi:ABC-type uncharacterized transport system permease subunit